MNLAGKDMPTCPFMNNLKYWHLVSIASGFNDIHYEKRISPGDTIMCPFPSYIIQTNEGPGDSIR